MRRALLASFVLALAAGCSPQGDPRLCGSGRGTPAERIAGCNVMLTFYEEGSGGYAANLAWRAKAREDVSDWAGAQQDYEASLEISPHLGGTLLGLGRVHLAQDDLVSAERYLRRAIEENDSGIASDLLGGYFLQNANYERARREYEALLQRKPENAIGHYGRGVARLHLGDATGREDIERARSLSPRIDEHFAERGLAPP